MNCMCNMLPWTGKNRRAHFITRIFKINQFNVEMKLIAHDFDRLLFRCIQNAIFLLKSTKITLAYSPFGAPNENILHFGGGFVLMSSPQQCSDSFTSEVHSFNIVNGNQLSATYCLNTIENSNCSYLTDMLSQGVESVKMCEQKFRAICCVEWRKEMTKSTWSHVISITTMCNVC